MNDREKESLRRVVCQKGDITCCQVEAIVNAANPSLLGGGGVDGAIHRAAGPQLLDACRKLQPPGCKTGFARLTPGFGLEASFVIHTVGPIHRGGDHGEASLLASCYKESLTIAAKKGVRTIAFPAISCGIYGYPIPVAAEIALTSIASFLARDEVVETVFMVLFSDDTHRVFMDTQRRLQG